MTPDASDNDPRATFMKALALSRRRNTVRIVGAVVCWAAFHGFAQTRQPETPSYVGAEVIADLALLFALALGFVTPWTQSHRETLWQRKARRAQRAAPPSP